MNRSLAARALCIGVMGILLSGCPDSSSTPPIQECNLGEKICDSEGAGVTECVEFSDGSLVWATPTPCDPELTCVAGRCTDGCGGCDTPPSGCTLEQGTCAEGKCSYDLKPQGTTCDDEDPCSTGDSCSAGECAGVPMLCQTPPQSMCADENVLTVFATPGRCTAGECAYATAEVVCSLGCDRGLCRGDPCRDVICNTPPGFCYQAQGFCVNGACMYLYDDAKTCNDGDPCTTNDRCIGGTCGGTPAPCDDPPANTCKNSRTLISHAGQGECTEAGCAYTSAEVTCPHGCDAAAGACKGDPCDGVVCHTPPGICYSSPGNCQEGRCTYAPDDGKLCSDANPCTDGDACKAGVCSGSPKVCNTPQANTCLSASLLKVNTAPGSCVNGACVYGSAEVTCGTQCDQGICMGDPCAQITCDTPPADECYTVPGICSSGSCTYLPTVGVACDDGEACTTSDKCVGDGSCMGTSSPCFDGLSCTTDTCNGQGGCTFPVLQDACLLSIEGQKICFMGGEINPLNTCQHCAPLTSTAAWTAATGTVEASWTFSDGTLQGFQVLPAPPVSAVKWQLDTTRAASAPYSIYFGDVAGQTYNDPGLRVWGHLLSPQVTLPAVSSKLCLAFKLFKDTEHNAAFDQLFVGVLPSGSVLWQSGLDARYADTQGEFLGTAVDLSALAGQSVQFVFSFDSLDGEVNGGEGVYLDDIQVLSNCAP